MWTSINDFEKVCFLIFVVWLLGIELLPDCFTRVLGSNQVLKLNEVRTLLIEPSFPTLQVLLLIVVVYFFYLLYVQMFMFIHVTVYIQMSIQLGESHFSSTM